MLSWWTIRRASGVGASAALASLVLWIAFGAWPERLLIPFAAALALTAFCGASILFISARDMTLRPKRGKMMRAIRGFDLVLGFVLAAVPLWVLSELAPELGL